VLVISSKNRRRRKKLTFFNSMHFQLFFVILLSAAIPLFCMRGILLNNVKDKIRATRMESTMSHAEYLAEQIISLEYLDGKNTEFIAAKIEQLAELYDGRVIIVDDSFNVYSDSYSRLSNKKIISEEMIKSMNGIDTVEYDESTDMITLARGIIDEDSGEIRGSILMSVTAADLTETYASIRNISFVVAAIFFFALIILSLVLARIFTKPFKDMTQSINRIAEGHFDEEVHLTGFVEIEQISDTFNVMINKLQVLEDSRQEFVSNVSHELKTPITSIKVLADSLNMQEDVPVELYKEFMKDIVDEIDRENTIINDLLALVKMDKTAGELNIANVNINHLLELILKRLRPIAAKRNIELVFESLRTVAADCDEVKLTLAFSNLVENGIKYNNAGGFVKVSLDADHKYFYVKVSDSGIGIPSEYQDKIFERFYRIDKARSRETGGTGLGLAITRNIILMHNGSIKIKSKEDEGTVFTVRIPLNYII